MNKWVARLLLIGIGAVIGWATRQDVDPDVRPSPSSNESSAVASESRFAESGASGVLGVPMIDDVLRRHDVTTDDRAVLHDARRGYLRLGYRIEDGAIGFHGVHPPITDAASSVFVGGSDEYYAVTDLVGLGDDPFGTTTRYVAWTRAFPNRLVRSARVVDDPDRAGRTQVVIRFDADGLTRLDAMVRTDLNRSRAIHSDVFSDVLTDPPPTFFDVSLVADGRTHGTWSAADFVSANDPDREVVVARGLERRWAEELVRRLGF